ncbi:hypothetical protein DFH06DRAFT_1364403 [Mycena polygramma]|nr:hypothetical protein DFH06DRAFT_1364403 [Mycena polygramma]
MPWNPAMGRRGTPRATGAPPYSIQPLHRLSSNAPAPNRTGVFCDNSERIQPWVADAHRVLQVLYLSNCLVIPQLEVRFWKKSGTGYTILEKKAGLNTLHACPESNEVPLHNTFRTDLLVADARRVLQVLYTPRSVPRYSGNVQEQNAPRLDLVVAQRLRFGFGLSDYKSTSCRGSKGKIQLSVHASAPGRTGSSARMCRFLNSAVLQNNVKGYKTSLRFAPAECTYGTIAIGKAKNPTSKTERQAKKASANWNEYMGGVIILLRQAMSEAEVQDHRNSRVEERRSPVILKLNRSGDMRVPKLGIVDRQSRILVREQFEHESMIEGSSLRARGTSQRNRFEYPARGFGSGIWGDLCLLWTSVGGKAGEEGGGVAKARPSFIVANLRRNGDIRAAFDCDPTSCWTTMSAACNFGVVEIMPRIAWPFGDACAGCNDTESGRSKSAGTPLSPHVPF